MNQVHGSSPLIDQRSGEVEGNDIVWTRGQSSGFGIWLPATSVHLSIGGHTLASSTWLGSHVGHELEFH